MSSKQLNENQQETTPPMAPRTRLGLVFILCATAGLIVCLLLAQMFRSSKELLEMKPTSPEIIFIDAETKKSLTKIRMLESTSAPYGVDGTFSERHNPTMSALSLGEGMTTSVGLKTSIATPLTLRFGSDGYEPAEIVIQPGQEGRISLQLTPVAAGRSSLL
jgi:hypothetical protein